MRQAILSVIGLSIVLPLTTQAHHSAAAFDRSHPVTMTGTVKQFIWSNPHTWVKLLVPNGKGGEDEYMLEGPPLGMMASKGWNGKTLKTGDKVRMLVAPYKDGTKRGEFMVVRNDKGEVLKF
ncbi:MAG: DUF6152 family protein [Steroidobacteraceae bacterium]